jgi:hypothetical protein
MRSLLTKAAPGAVLLAVTATPASPPATAVAAQQQGQQGCIAPDLVGVSLAKARHALSASGCGLQLRQLPGHGHFVTPAGPDERQLVGAQRPARGAHTRAVTLWLEPLCSQAAQPGPESRGPESEKGPTEIVAGLFLEGGPLRLGPRCRRAMTAAGTVTVATLSGQPVASRSVGAGSFAVFPLKPGRYVVSGTIGSATPAPRQVTVVARRETRLNLVSQIR